MKKDSPKRILIKSDDEILHEFENAYIDALTDSQLVITYYDKSVLYKTIIHLDADVVTGVEIKED
jgi:hypothetical protein